MTEPLAFFVGHVEYHTKGRARLGSGWTGKYFNIPLWIAPQDLNVTDITKMNDLFCHALTEPPPPHLLLWW